MFADISYLSLFIVVGIESIGVPLPGETALITAAIIAGTTHKLNIYLVILFVSLGAIIGDNIGFFIGRKLGNSFLRHYGTKIGLNKKRIKLGQYLFIKYGGKIVFFGRFVAILRVLAAFLAGANMMEWKRFFIFNVAGAITWATAYGILGYLFGEKIRQFGLGMKIIIFGISIVILIVTTIFLKRNEKRLEKEADEAIPDYS
jgi:membrane protein DedA with SNARE-associated domain